MAMIDGGGANAAVPKRVIESGLAVVHEGELVYPAAGSEAQAIAALDAAAQDITIYFPVEVEIRSVDFDGARMRQIAEDVLADMARSLATRR